ncbi:DUF2752 domain-containing protein [Leptospira licerasiae]|uniref:DUF2752 domain-containing protein n=1 Tax=Leptospira licerasiae TaxID=447106 RepID=UPI000248964D|nr:DUF2752 domain-containing protein [Leptospira licerasiae]EIE01828.1 PF10825 family protein [Leptospira licerasiae serovar Varillal str. VAR 010]
MWDRLRNQHNSLFQAIEARDPKLSDNLGFGKDYKKFLILEAGPISGPVPNFSLRFFLTILFSLIVFLTLTISISFLLPLDTESEHWFTICWWKHLTGWDCPGCGLSRSVICFFRGDFSRSWDYHPFGIPVSILGISGFIIRWNLGKQVWRKILENRNTEIFAYLGVISLFVWYFFKHFD